MKSAIGSFERWVASRGDPGFSVEQPGGHRRVRYHGNELIYFYYAKRWIKLWLKDATAEERARAAQALSRPEGISDARGLWSCQLINESDVAFIESLLAERVTVLRGGAGV
jgi:hypothetical protein